MDASSPTTLDVAATARAAALGALTAAIAYAAHRIQSSQFPLDMLTVEMIVLPVFGLALGLARGERWFAPARERGRALTVSVLFLGAMAMNRGISLHYFVSEAYYPYPKPAYAWWRLVAFVVSWIAEVGLFAWLGHRWRREIVRPRALGVGLLGAGAGITVAAYSIFAFGAQPVLVAAVALATLLGLRAVVALVVPVAGAALLLLSARAPYSFLTWRALPQDYTLLEQRWTPYYFLNFIALQNDRCLGGIYSYLMLWQVCDDPSLLQREFRYFHGTLGRGKRSMLGIGRVDGTTALTLASQDQPLERVTLVEVDPVVADRLNGTLARYNGDLAHRPEHRIVSGDWRSFLERDDQRYDVVALDGLGIALYTIPLTNFPHEGWLFTRESFHTIFDERLEKDGVLVVNWGSTRENEVYPLVANLPDDVARAAFWITFSEYPFSGLPLFLIAASRDHARIDALRGALDGVPPFKEVPLPEDLSRYRFTDDSPLVQRAVYSDGLFLGYPLAIAVLAAAIILVRRSRRKGLLGLGSSGAIALSGALASIGLAWLVSRHARLALPSGAALGALLVAGVWLAAAGVAAAIASQRWAHVATPGSALAAIVAVLMLRATPEPTGLAILLAAAVLGGFTGQLTVTSVNRAVDRARGTALYLMAAALGLVAYQQLLLRAGFAATASGWCAITTTLVALLALHRRASTG